MVVGALVLGEEGVELDGVPAGGVEGGDLGKSAACHVPGRRAIGSNHVALRMTPYPARLSV